MPVEFRRWMEKGNHAIVHPHMEVEVRWYQKCDLLTYGLEHILLKMKDKDHVVFELEREVIHNGRVHYPSIWVGQPTFGLDGTGSENDGLDLLFG